MAIAKPASAANGDTIHIGSTTTGTANTVLNGSQLHVNRTTGTSITGNNGAGTGVYGVAGNSAGTGTGVKGETLGGGIGVLGADTSASSAGTGVKGNTEIGVGVWGEGGSSTVRGTGLRGTSSIGAALLLDSTGLSMPPTSRTWTNGSFVNAGGDLWYCYGSGTGASSKWVKLSGAPIILDASYRAYDSRAGFTPLGVTKGKINNGQTRSNIDLKVGGGGNAIPNGISAAIVNLTATNTSSAGFLGLFASGTAWPGTSTINWSAVNTNIANTTIVAVNATSKVAVRAAGSTDFILDVIGFLP